MKRLFIWALMATMCVAVPIEIEAQEVVEYEFTGSILSSGPIGMKVKRNVPPGVRVGTSNSCTGGGHTADIYNWDKALLGGWTTLYVTHTNDESAIYFHDFKYDVQNIEWTRRSQIRAVTSVGYSWATRGDGSDFGYHDYEPDEDDELYSTGGELLYHRKDFIDKVASDGSTPTVPFSGLQALHVRVTSKLPLHAIAVDKFFIEYFRPEPQIANSPKSTLTYDEEDEIVIYGA